MNSEFPGLPAPTGKSAILIADDDPNIRLTFRIALETGGFIVALARTASEVRLLAHERPFGLLLLDLRLGADNGLKLLSDLRAAGITTPVLLVTAYGTLQDAVAAMKFGAIDFLTKPLDPARLRAAVGEILGRHAGCRPAANPPEESYEDQILEAKRALNAQEFSVARKRLVRALEIKSESADAHHLFGVLLEMNGNFDDARRYFRRAQQIDPNRDIVHA